ncbi:E3 ubiquitin-protein ligase TM129 [Contarinia nasturtii]|uniref:E3 ubiquitin-protein ligase TM129 n=1 Tax=Contarinia nasturtii TaxID=265458 RepID=UPI0012D45B6F|nr:E3 ubiquitin-protein ligase TM129 [Contarinia nasturtii]
MSSVVSSKSPNVNMQEAEFGFSILFFLFSFGIIYPPQEFESVGLTINNVFSSYLGSSDIEFIQYHLRRTCLTLLIHSILPTLYVVCYYLKFGDIIEYNAEVFPIFVLWNFLIFFLMILPVISATVIYYWCKDNYANHPLAQNLQKYSRENWIQAARDINAENRRDNKLCMKTSAIHSVVATANWIMKVSYYSVSVAHQSDTALIAIRSDSHDLSEISTESVQFVNIKVKPTRVGVSEFIIRINALDFKTLQDRMMRPITILDGVTFSKTVIDRFIEVFKQQVLLNPTYTTDEVILDLCFACMQARPNVKLQKKCTNEFGNDDTNNEHGCTNCYCRPMWCVDCLAKWFASRQDQQEKEIWLQQKCSCPMCRAKFCILDVCYVELNR